MISCKKLEIIIESVQIKHIVQIIDKLNLPGYTIIKDVSGRGSHGLHDGSGLDRTYQNGYIIVICSEEEASTLITQITPILEKYSGICISSDTQCVRSLIYNRS